MTKEKYVTVSALTKYIKRKFDQDPHLRDIYIKGEISNFKQHSSGHMYFTLKDEKSRISAVMFSQNNAALPFKPENGMKVLVRGGISVFEQSGNYQVYAKEMHADGVGDLFVAFQQLKERLEKERLFAAEHKKPLPLYPTVIGVITSPTGAAVRDMVTTLKRRYPMGEVRIIPALVQGPNAPRSIVQAIQQANRTEEIDVILLGRGGGSIEELWAFNEEAVARAIFDSDIPIISAVGHETDTTISDFVADVRAATPTAAAELAVPNYLELKKSLMSLVSKMTTALSHDMKQKEAALNRVTRSYAFRYPEKLYEQKVEQLDKVMERMHRESRRYMSFQDEKLKRTAQALSQYNPEDRLKREKENVLRQQKQLERMIAAIIRSKQQTFQGEMSKLIVLNPLNIMDRGYSIAFNGEKQVIKSKEQVQIGEGITVVLKDGQLVCEVKDLKEDGIHE